MVVYLGFMAMGVVFHLVPPILPGILDDLQLSHGQGGLLMATFALPGVLLSFVGGWTVDRFGPRPVGALGLLIMGLATMLMARAGWFPWVLSARLLTGIGAVFVVIAMQRMVNRLFQGRPLGLPMGIAGSAIPFGIVLIYNLAHGLEAELGWRAVPWRAGMAAVAAALVFFVAGRWFFLRRHDPAWPRDGSGVSESPPGMGVIWVAGLIWFLINGAMTAFLTFAPDHFIQLGLGLEDQGLITSFPLWGSALLGPLVGLTADRRGGKTLFIATGMACQALALVLVALDVATPLVVGAGLGLAMAFVVTPLLSLPGELLPPSHQGRGFGILSTCGNAGIFLTPPAAGWIRDLSSGYFWPFMMMAALAGGGVLAGVWLTKLHGKRH